MVDDDDDGTVVVVVSNTTMTKPTNTMRLYATTEVTADNDLEERLLR